MREVYVQRGRRRASVAKGGRRASVAKGLLAGAVGGLAASCVMNAFQSAWSSLTHGRSRSHGAQSLQTGEPRGGDDWPRGLAGERDAAETRDAAERVAAGAAEALAGRELTRAEQDAGGTLVHYLYGTATGAAYGLAAELAPVATTGFGLPFGAAVWLGADELVVPALGLSKPAEDYPLSVHAHAFVSHLVYGLTTELVRAAARRVM